jgi:hypothetical protein
MPDFAAWTPNDWAATGQVSTAVIAVLAAIFAFVQIRQARTERREKDAPYVIVFSSYRRFGPMLLTSPSPTSGHTLARDATISFDRKLESTSRTGDLDEAKVVREGISTMPPGMKLSTLFDLTHERIKTELPMSYTVTVSLENSRGKRQRLQYPLDLGIYYGLEGFRAQGMHQMSKSLSDIEVISAK